ncbi:phytanoyl-CoA dioxygenase family protein [Armatimonas rosea]|uniref:Ectoine hydroxylase-related dioxygenase (Phytanoyl-CoA dioxygenase family) n=1 Tax=Armatimonas rosea TaxID=685828 RepID=A0A7W9W992_ARMRO|nr:phytanoyl-CoA dioxygenase family protein [Armatimonas rosea]MBB6053613.1 ectoine hydroxylase-related dioxygenase (phytanoyl-CoA dioxygenase family) [Armatimonas rosea]
MNEQEKYFFDLWGFIVVKQALTPEHVAALNALVDTKLVEESATEKTSHRFGRVLEWGTETRETIANPRIVPYLHDLIGPRPRLDHDYLDVILKPGLGPIGATLHGGGTPFDAGQFYRFSEGRMHNGLTVVAYALKDCRPGDGGFACIPGSHKSNYRTPQEWVNMADGLAEVVRPVPCEAGDAVIFTEALTHGTLPWNSDNQRRTLFLKYTAPQLAWGVPSYDPHAHPDLPDDARRMLEGPNARYRGRKGGVE